MMLTSASVATTVGAATGGARSPSAAVTKPKAQPVTYARDVAPILNANCVSCHRAGEAGPFPLTSYNDARKRAATIAAVVGARVMPPWKLDSHGEFQNERRLSDAQIATLTRWARGGAKPGDLKAAPTPPKFRPGWALGRPDLVVSPSGEYALEAEGRDVYRCFVIPTDFPADRFVSALDVRPGNRAVVHHVLAYVDTTGKARKLDAKDPGEGYSTGGGIGFLPAGMLGGWAPGAMPAQLPPSTGILLPKGADIVLEVHYHKSGKPERDRSQVALYFGRDEAVERPLRYFPLVNLGLRIPPGAKDHVVRADLTVPADTTLVNVFPHMHLLGKQMTVTATLPDGTTKRLIHVPDWDFNWQGFYAYKEPVKLPRGTKVELVAHYDNSADNPRNPSHPPKTVTWGEQTTDEMCLAFLGFTVDAERRPKAAGRGGTTP
jgi:mono/diheme cytochrome c family protein